VTPLWGQRYISVGIKRMEYPARIEEKAHLRAFSSGEQEVQAAALLA
jgi:hypothetical protein